MTEALCPKCAAPRPPDLQACPRCGVIYARARPAAARPAPPPAAQAHVPPQAPGRLSLGETELLLRRLSNTLGAGLSLTHSAAPFAGLPTAIRERFTTDAVSGVPLPESFAALQLLDPAGQALLEAADRRGQLVATLDRLALRCAERRGDLRRILLAFLYPSILLAAAAFIVPAPRGFAYGWRAYVAAGAPLWVVLVALLGFVGWLAFRPPPPSSPLARSASRIGRRVPLLSGVLREQAIARFAEALSGCLAAGLSIREALALAAGSADHPAFSTDSMVGAIDRGATLTEALRAVPLLPLSFVAETEVGERTGALDRSLRALAKFHADAARTRVWALVGVLTALGFGAAVVLTVVMVIDGARTYFELLDRQIDSQTR